MKLFLALLCLIGLAVPAAANPLSNMYSASDPLYEVIEMLSIESGTVPPSSASPWSGHELYSRLQRIDRESLSAQGRALYDEAADRLQRKDQPRKFTSALTIAPELYINLNEDEDITQYDWAYDVSYRKPFLYFEAEGVLGEHFYGIFSSEARKLADELIPEGGEQNLTAANLSTNILFSPDDAEHAFPYTAFAGLSSESISLSVGRDTLSWGRGNTGNLLIGDHAPYHDFISFAAANDDITYRFLAMPMDELDEDGESKGLGFTGQNVRLFTAHRLEARPFPRLAVAFTEGAMFFSERMDLRMFSPMMFLHNYRNYKEMKNFFQLDIEFMPAPGKMLYSQLFIDQIQIPAELDSYDKIDLFPNAFGVLGGIEIVEPVGSGYFTGYLEAAFTSTYMYLRRNISDDEKDEYDKEDYLYYTDHWNLDLIHGTGVRGGRDTHYLGYRHGPDTVLAAAHAGYKQPGSWSMYAEVEFSVHGEQGGKFEGKDQQLVDTGEEFLYQLLPSGNKQYRLVTGIGGEYKLPGLPLKLFSRLNTVNLWNEEDGGTKSLFDIQASLGAELSVPLL